MLDKYVQCDHCSLYYRPDRRIHHYTTKHPDLRAAEKPVERRKPRSAVRHQEDASSVDWANLGGDSNVIWLLLALPADPVSVNETAGTHWSVFYRTKKAWIGAARQLAEVSGLGPLPPCQVKVIIPFREKRRRDPHNYVGTVCKWIIDGLVEAGVWPDDNPDWVEVAEPELVVRGGSVLVQLTIGKS